MKPQANGTFQTRHDPGSQPVGGSYCPMCGTPQQTGFRRGAILVTADPVEVFWRGMQVPLSPNEAHVLRFIALRGRARFDMIDKALEDIGASPGTRSIILLRIRQKFMALGSENPLVRLGKQGVRLRLDADHEGSASTVIGINR